VQLGPIHHLDLPRRIGGETGNPVAMLGATQLDEAGVATAQVLAG
jgi:hypothetical protein